MLKKILIALIILVIGFVIVVALRPSDFRITRSALISAPTQTVFSQVNDFHNWEAWSPWAKLDLEAKNSFEGAPSGTGATFRWSGNHKVGEGNMTILESHPNDLIRIKLEFLKPFAATNIAEFTFKAEGNQTAITWSMSGKNNFMAKAFGLFVNCDKMVGDQFEQGLTQMKSVVEAVNKK